MYLYQLPKLTDIYNELTPSENLTLTESDDIIESCCILIDYFITHNTLHFSHPNFHDNLSNYVKTFISLQFPFSFDNKYSNNLTDDLKDEIEILQQESEKIYFKHIIPKRSYPKTFIRIKDVNIPELSKKIQYLKDIPQPDQRTNEWYHFRHNLLTEKQHQYLQTNKLDHW